MRSQPTCATPPPWERRHERGVCSRAPRRGGRPIGSLRRRVVGEHRGDLPGDGGCKTRRRSRGSSSPTATRANSFTRSAATTPGAGDRPDSYYGISKLFGEALGRLYADRYGMQIACLRGSAPVAMSPRIRGCSAPGSALAMRPASRGGLPHGATTRLCRRIRNLSQYPALVGSRACGGARIRAEGRRGALCGGGCSSRTGARTLAALMNRKGAGGRTSNLAIDDCRSARLTEGRTSGIKPGGPRLCRGEGWSL